MYNWDLGNPYPLKQNMGKSFQGSIVLGKGFVITMEQAQALIVKDPRNKDVLFPYLNGEDLNNDPEQKPSRWVINFFDWSEEKARTYPDCFEIVERLVKPERQRWKKDSKGNDIVGTYALRKPLPQKWWIYGEKRPALYETISKIDQVMVVPLVSKFSPVELIPTNIVFMHKLGVIVLNDYYIFSILSSTIHNVWCWKNSSTLGAGTLNYSTTDCFETFPFPKINSIIEDRLIAIGYKYHSFRKNIQRDFRIGLTKLYNQFHNKILMKNTEFQCVLSDSIYRKDLLLIKKHIEEINEYSFERIKNEINKLRELHIELDNIVIDTYGWNDIVLNHDFYEVDYLPENDRVRFTIHPEARKEILKRLLLLNHKQYEEEQIIESSPKGKRLKTTVQNTLFFGSE